MTQLYSSHKEGPWQAFGVFKHPQLTVDKFTYVTLATSIGESFDMETVFKTVKYATKSGEEYVVLPPDLGEVARRFANSRRVKEGAQVTTVIRWPSQNRRYNERTRESSLEGFLAGISVVVAERYCSADTHPDLTPWEAVTDTRYAYVSDGVEVPVAPDVTAVARFVEKYTQPWKAWKLADGRVFEIFSLHSGRSGPLSISFTALEDDPENGIDWGDLKYRLGTPEDVLAAAVDACPQLAIQLCLKNILAHMRGERTAVAVYVAAESDAA